MPDEPLQQILDEMRARIQAELDGQVQALHAREAEAIARARQEAESEADQRWTAKVEAVRAEWTARLDSEIAAARAEAEKRLVDETMRIRSEADQAVAAERERGAAQLETEREEAAAGIEAERQRAAAQLDAERGQIEQQLAAERQEAAAGIEAERQRAAVQLDAERRRIEQQLEQVRAAFEVERDQIEREARARQRVGVDAARVVSAARAMDAARTLSEALTALARSAAEHAPRAALFILDGARLEEWPVPGVVRLSRQPVDLDRSGLLHAALTRGTRASVPGDAAEAPSFTGLPDGRAAVAVPLVVDGQPVALLYADEGASGPDAERQGWADAVELLARHGAACVAHLTAVRSLQLLHGGNGSAHGRAVPQDDEQSARRYARLLVSEIKLYNEGAVRVGRERRDLLQRLKAEIDRAKRLYEERVSSTVTERASYFQQELVQTLAGGDPALLGS